MERDFEKEFKELKQSEVPDLWNRIEAGLTPKPAVSHVYRWALLAAACLCVLIIVPVLSLVRSDSSSGMPEDMSGGMEIPTEDGGWSATDEAAASESAENEGSGMNGYAEVSDAASGIYGGADASVEESVMEDSLTNGLESPESGSFSAADSLSDDSEMRNGIIKEAQSLEASRDSASSKKEGEESTVDWSSVLQEGQLLNAVKIRVSEIKQTGSTDDVYTVRSVIVSPDGGNYLPEGMELTLLCNAETAYDFDRTPQGKKLLQTGEIYTVDLRYEGDGEFVVKKAVK